MNTEIIQNILGDIQYPIDKAQLLKEAEAKGAQEVLPVLKELPEQKFSSMEEVMSKLPLERLGGFMKEL